MHNRTRLSAMPDFLPAGKPGSAERRACALGTFTNQATNAALFQMLAERRLAAQPHIQHTAPATPCSEPARMSS